MSYFFLLLEIFIYGFAFFIFVKKKELALVYLPVLIFSYTVITPLIPIYFFYGTLSLLRFSLIGKNAFFYRNNLFAIILFVYFFVLLSRSAHLAEMKWALFFSVILLFLLIPLVIEIYKKHSQEAIFNELSTSAFIILAIFVANVLASTIFRYSSFFFYGITKGILYGNLSATDFNIISIAIFIVVLKLLTKKNLVYLAVGLASLAFVMLSMRRSVMIVSVLGIGTGMLILIINGKLKKIFLIGVIAVLIGVPVVLNSGMASTFEERYELRDLEDRDIGEEKRFIEYELLYNDMFVYGRYSPWLGFELFNSWGNYGNRLFEQRSLHSDLTSITHSSGLIGVTLYLLMMITAFVQAYKAAKKNTGMPLVLFCSAALMMYTTTGRYTELGSMLLLFLVLYLPMAINKNETSEAVPVEEDNLAELKTYYVKSDHVPALRNTN